jgi:hypothetical protein
MEDAVINLHYLGRELVNALKSESDTLLVKDELTGSSSRHHHRSLRPFDAAGREQPKRVF